MRRLLVSFLIIPLLGLLQATPVFAERPGQIILGDPLMWRNLVGTGDLMVVVPYELEADGTTTGDCPTSEDWDDCNPIDAFADLVDEDDVLIVRRTLPRLGPGLVGFYLTTADMTAMLPPCVAGEPCVDFTDVLHDTLTLKVYGSPTLFFPTDLQKKVVARSEAFSSSNEEALEHFRDMLVKLVEENIQDAHVGTSITNPYVFEANILAEDGRITLAGRDFATAITPLVVAIVPGAFQLSGAVLSEAVGFNYQSFFTADTIIGDQVIPVARTEPFEVGQNVTIRDTLSHEIGRVIAVGPGLQITIDTLLPDPPAPGLAAAYTVARLANVTITGFFSMKSQDINVTKTALNEWFADFGVSNWVGGFLFLTLTTIAVATVGGSFAGSWVGGLGIFPILLLLLADIGIIQEGLIFMVLAMFLLGGGMLYARGIGK
jgi:hypothetical protein